VSGEASVELELDRSINVAKWPGSTASHVGFLNVDNLNLVQGPDISNAIPLDERVQKLSEDQQLVNKQS
jgi:hypothetical protein